MRSSRSGWRPADLIVDDLLRHAQERPDKVALRFLPDGERETTQLTYAELARQVQALAGRLQGRGLAGEPVVIALPAGPDYIVSVLACMFAGALAVPMPEPPRGRVRDRWEAIMGRLQPAALIAATPLEDGPPHVDIGGEETAPWRRPPIDEASIAFIQYTSGSTSTPKGVVVTQGALSANRAMMQEAFAPAPDWRSLTWLPPYHDMGLLGLLQPLGGGLETIILPPLAVVQRPMRWIRAMSAYRAQVTGGPCYGYESATARVAPEELAALDLSNWRLAYCGAEPVRPGVLQDFAATFAPAGFDAAALYPCYGMAEAVLFITGAERDRGLVTATVDGPALRDLGRAQPPAEDATARVLSACGHPWGDCEVLIRDADGQTMPDGNVGEVWVSGSHIASGYFRDEVQTSASFGDGGLRTGDLGFVRDGDLYLVGRIKDVIIVRGVKHHAEDLEAIAREAHPALADGGGVAFAAQDGQDERLVIGYELNRSFLRSVSPGEVEAAISSRVLSRCGVRPDLVIALRPGAVHRTSSGKVQRHRCRNEFAQGAWPTDKMYAHAPAAGSGQSNQEECA